MPEFDEIAKLATVEDAGNAYALTKILLNLALSIVYGMMAFAIWRHSRSLENGAFVCLMIIYASLAATYAYPNYWLLFTAVFPREIDLIRYDIVIV